MHTVVGGLIVGGVTGCIVWLGGLPMPAQLLLAVVLGDLATYGFHRLAHRPGSWLWRMHAIHHSAPRLYWLNAARTHPLEGAVLVAGSVLPAVLLGMSPLALALLGVVVNAHAVLRHANVDARLGLLDDWVSMARSHRLHHHPDAGRVGNFGVNTLVWDRVFGTLDPFSGPAPEKVGLDGHPDFPTAWLDQLLLPWRWPWR